MRMHIVGREEKQFIKEQASAAKMIEMSPATTA